MGPQASLVVSPASGEQCKYGMWGLHNQELSASEQTPTTHTAPEQTPKP